MSDDDRDEVRQYVADLTELTATMRRREKLDRGSPEWKAAVELEERLIARIQNWARRHEVPRQDE
jgi:hypothetical protein